jgi:hypothetical protein
MPKTIRKIAHPPKLERKSESLPTPRVSSGKDAMLHLALIAGRVLQRTDTKAR